jgi:aspartate-semialdehyde dehydrogenase
VIEPLCVRVAVLVGLAEAVAVCVDDMVVVAEPVLVNWPEPL